MSTKIAINGFGRIGRLVFRHLMARDALEVVALNDIAPLDNLAYLLRHDSVHVDPGVAARAEGETLRWGEKTVRFTSERDPGKLPWKELGVDIVIEASGVFTKKEDAAKHLDAGADRVVLTAPGKGGVATFCMGVNEEKFDPDKDYVVSNASCTTNCLAPVAKVLNAEFGIEYGFLTTIHAATSSQVVVDAPSKRWRRGRSALLNIVPTSTGAAVAVGLVLPELEGKLDGMAMRVPVGNGSVIDLVARTSKSTDAEAVNEAFRRAAGSERLNGILGVSDEELVSTDIIGSTYSALVDSLSTMSLGDRFVKVVAWYDNEWGYARRVVDLAAYIGRRI